MRYIDADKLKSEFDYKHIDMNKTTACVHHKNILEIINQQPTADVVEVVRCKDCKYGEVDNADFPNQYLCHHHGSAWNESNHYCSYGERAEK